MSHRTAALMVAVAAVVAIALAGLLWRFLPGGNAHRELPNIDAESVTPLLVSIRDPIAGTRVAASDPLAVVVEASGAEQFTRYELWVDGRLTRTYTPAPDSPPDQARLTWLPETTGVHALIARVFDAAGRIGRSDSVAVDVLPGAAGGAIGLTVEVQPGNTRESIAASLGVQPLEVQVPSNVADLVPGTTVLVTMPPGQLPEGYVDDDGLAPAPDESPSPEPSNDNAVAAEPADDAAPDQLPWGFRRVDDPEPPTPPDGLSATHAGGCDVRLQWDDRSESETGFRIYRMSGAGTFSPIRDLAANNVGAALTYTDRLLFGGHYEYVVASVNAGGESESGIASVDVGTDDCAVTAPPVAQAAALMLQFEATSLQTTDSYDGVYCYLSLARLEPYARVPEFDDVFLAPQGDEWNVAYWLSGIGRRVFGQSPDAPVPVRMECWGRRGQAEPDSLGSFEASHPRDEWDGRDLAGAAAGFSVVYHIGPYVPTLRIVALEDNRIPSPSNVHVPTGRDDCEARADFSDRSDIDGVAALWACAEIADHVIVWDWRESDVYPRAGISGFRVRYRAIDEASADAHVPWQALGDIGPYAQLFPIPMPPCGEHFEFQVTAFVRPADGSEDHESPVSASFPVVPRGCPPPQVEVEITIVSVDVSGVDDGVRFRCALFVLCVPVYDFELEAYGRGGFDVVHNGGSRVDYGTNFLFFTDDCGGIGESFLAGCVGFHPLVFGVGLGDTRTIRFEDQQMQVCTGPASCSGWGTRHNTFAVTVQDGDSIEFRFNLRDDDVGSPDDTWCGTDEDYSFASEIDESHPFTMGPYSLDRWVGIWQEEWSNRGHALADQDADCTMHVELHGRRLER